MKTFPASSPQQAALNLQRVLEAIQAINTCLPTTSGAQAATAGLTNACTTFDIGLGVLALQLEAVICWLGNGGAAANCSRPWPCDTLTIITDAQLDGGCFWDYAAPGFLFPYVTTSNGGIYFAPNQSEDAFPMLFLKGDINFPLLTNVTGDLVCIFQFNLLSFLAPLLSTVTGNLVVGSNQSLENLDLHSLTSVDGRMEVGANLITGLSCPLLTSVGQAFSCGGDQVASYDLPLLASIGGNVIINGTPLVSFRLPSLVTWNGTQWDSSFAALDAATVNYLLALMVSLGGNNKTILLQGGTNAAPTGQGLTDKATLQGLGWTVTTN